ncbi:unnamed protein product [Lymnaea stagnalis]|uniref:Uncharacterized protein n=1 Tax=Lymnaea stagnalis TaxID=6523 RepID=A0AAV2HBA5_LYMST
MKSNTAIVFLLVVAQLTSGKHSVTSSPLNQIDPVIYLDLMAPDHACLFICNICFPETEATDDLLECSNSVCGPIMEGACAMDKLLWLGSRCKHLDVVEKMWSSNAKH